LNASSREQNARPWEYPEYRGYMTIYAILSVFAIAVRNWSFRAQYTAKKRSRALLMPGLHRQRDRMDRQ